jgi:hypothetical protein
MVSLLLLLIVTAAQAVAIYYTWPMFYFPPLVAMAINVLILKRFQMTPKNSASVRRFSFGIALIFCLVGWYVGCVWAVNTFGE